jgi:hypothetical protein
MRGTCKGAIASGLILGTVLALGGVAGAAKPVVHACVGTTHSDDAHALGPGSVGDISSTFAHQPDTVHPGLGDGMPQLQAGQVPDDVVANTCN